jgi:hypothetical protein
MFTQQFNATNFNQYGVFLLDGIAATLSAILLFAVLLPLQTYIGLPEICLLQLGAGAAILAVFALVCYFVKIKNRIYFLSISILGNLAYAVMASSWLCTYAYRVKPIGFVYFSIEVFLVMVVMMLEVKVATGIGMGRY